MLKLSIDNLNIKNVLQQYSQQYNLAVTIFISIQLYNVVIMFHTNLLLFTV